MTALRLLALSGLGRDAARLALALAVALLLALAFAVASVVTLVGAAVPGLGVADARPADIPADQRAVMQAAAATCGLPWQVLAGVAEVESDFGRDMATSSAGAVGYGQFLPATWAAYGAGGDPYDYRDALPAMARYLCANGGRGDLRRALYAYNHADWYVERVLAVAARYGYLAPGSAGGRVVALARGQLGMPYVWGGDRPATSFDCSGLVQWAYGQVGVRLPRTAQAQYDATVRVTPDQLQPGDLLFYQSTYPSADRITHVGLYIGGGEMINAANPQQGVVVVPLSDPYWAAHYAGAGRVGG